MDFVARRSAARRSPVLHGLRAAALTVTVICNGTVPGEAAAVRSRRQGPEFTDQALSLAVLDAVNPLLRRANSAKGELAHDLHKLGGPVLVSRVIRTSAIAGGYTNADLQRWWTAEAGSDQKQVALSEELGDEMFTLQAALEQARRTLRILPTLGNVPPHYSEYDYILRGALDGPFFGHWFKAIVDSPCRYLLGYQELAFALDLMFFLNELQRTGKARDENGHVIASLADERGQPYRHLVAEYVLHEVLEGSMLHDDIIALTTEAFGHGVYRARALKQPNRIPAKGARVFTRPGQTPLGRALRSFISWRVELRARELLGEAVGVSFFDPSFQTVVSAHGMAKGVLDNGDSNAVLRIGWRRRELDIPLSRVVDFREMGRLDFGPLGHLARDVSGDIVMEALQAGDIVMLRESQIRSMAGTSLRSPSLASIFRELLHLRDRQGIRIHLSQRIGWTEIVDSFRQIRAIGRNLAALGLQMRVNHIAFNAPAVDPELAFSYLGMPPRVATDAWEYMREIVSKVLNTLVAFTTVTLLPAKLAPRIRTDSGAAHRTDPPTTRGSALRSV